MLILQRWLKKKKKLTCLTCTSLSGCSPLKSGLLTSSLRWREAGCCCCSSAFQGMIDPSSANSFHMYWIKLTTNTSHGEIGLADKRTWKMCLVLVQLSKAHCCTPTCQDCLSSQSYHTELCWAQFLWMHGSKCFRKVIRKSWWWGVFHISVIQWEESVEEKE